MSRPRNTAGTVSTARQFKTVPDIIKLVEPAAETFFSGLEQFPVKVYIAIPKIPGRRYYKFLSHLNLEIAQSAVKRMQRKPHYIVKTASDSLYGNAADPFLYAISSGFVKRTEI